MPVPAPPQKRRPLRGAVWVLVIALLIGAAFVGFGLWHNAAKGSYVDAVAAVAAANERTAKANNDLTTAETHAQEQQSAFASLTTPGALVDGAAYDALSTAVTTLGDQLDSAPDPATAIKVPEQPPVLPWELTAKANELNDAARGASAGTVSDAADALTTASTDVDEKAAAVFSGVATVSPGLLDANISAENLKKIAFVDAAAKVTEAKTLTTDSVKAFNDYVTAFDAMRTSYESEMADKAGPLLDARLQIEAFARSLAPGIMLDFDWQDTVNGFGSATSVGGTAQWWMQPPRATITLSNSAAQMWGGVHDPMVRAVVAHEVGHAITVRCGDKYTWDTPEHIEEWATAWAIAQGYTGEGNGVSLYGQPRQEIIDAARTCH